MFGLFLLMLQDDVTAYVPRSWDELLLAGVAGALPLLFGYFRSRVNRNRARISNLEYIVRANGADMGKTGNEQREKETRPTP